MRLPRFRGLRGRLSYANVIATLALFFALTGGAMATGKYLTTTDPITSGDLAGSTYGSPVIAAGKVTTGKILDGAVTTGKIADGAITSSKFDSAATAPNAAKLAGFDITAHTSPGGFVIGPSDETRLDLTCAFDRLPVHVAVAGGPDIRVTAESWNSTGYLQGDHSEIVVTLTNQGTQNESFDSVTLYCLGSG
jgi:hypothetical protein